MISKEASIDFFNQYASTMNNALFGDSYDGKIILNSFADYVVGANPLGIAGSKNDGEFDKAINQGIDFYKRIGITSMNITNQEVTILDDFHALVKVYWNSFYRKDDFFGEIPFEVIYIVQRKDHLIKIFAYITGDEMSALKRHRLVP